jgi:hypothetical protein
MVDCVISDQPFNFQTLQPYNNLIEMFVIRFWQTPVNQAFMMFTTVHAVNVNSASRHKSANP